MSLGPAMPPHNIAAETGVIASVLVDPDAMHEIVEVLRPAHFFRDSHGVIYGALRDLYCAGRPLDSISLEEELRRRGELQKVGGIDAILDIQASEPHGLNARYWAQVVFEKSVARSLIGVAQEILRDGYSNQFEAAELLSRAQASIFQVAEEGVRQHRDMSDLMGSVITRYEARERGESPGLATGIYELDRLTLGFRPGELIILAARPSMGKTALALDIAANVAMGDRPGSVFLTSMEMGADSLADRLVVSIGSVDGQAFKAGKLDSHRYSIIKRTAFQLADVAIVVDDTGTQTAETIMAAARRANAKRRLDLIIIDYLQLMEGSDYSRDGRQGQVARISRKMKNLARDLDVPVLALSQLNRKVEERQDKRPMLSDLRDSGAIEQDADIVLMMFRPGYYDASDQSQRVDLEVAKQRNGPTGRIELAFIKECGRFLDYKDYLDQTAAY